jgi:hypothetical protein
MNCAVEVKRAGDEFSGTFFCEVRLLTSIRNALLRDTRLCSAHGPAPVW